MGIAATHRGLDGAMLEGQDAGQKLTRDEALALYTTNPWKALGVKDGTSGMLVPGARADIAVADRNVFELAPEDLCKVKNQATFFEGRRVF